MSLTFTEKLRHLNAQGLYACAGLDPVEEMMSQRSWRKTLHDLVLASHSATAAFKPNWAYYLNRQSEGGLVLLRDLCREIRSHSRHTLIILDLKCGDIDRTNRGYVEWAFEDCGADAVTVHSYTGPVAMAPFLAHEERGVFVLCRTTNPGAEALQEVRLANGDPYFLHVAKDVAQRWNAKQNCGLVVGATFLEPMEVVREALPHLPLLIPGYGRQKGDLLKTIQAATRTPGYGSFLINQSSSYMYQPDLETSRAQLVLVNDAVKEYLQAR